MLKIYVVDFTYLNFVHFMVVMDRTTATCTTALQSHKNSHLNVAVLFITATAPRQKKKKRAAGVRGTYFQNNT